MDAKFKSCPFCGSDENMLEVLMLKDDVYIVQCFECGARSGRCESPEFAKDVWNRRENDENQTGTCCQDKKV